MKKILILVLLALLVPAMLFAGRGVFDYSLGVNAQYRSFSVVKAEMEAGNYENWFKPEHFKFGAESRLKLSILELDSVVWFGTLKDINGLPSNVSNGDEFLLDGYLTTGLSFDLFGFVRLGVGGGPSFIYTEAFGNYPFLIGLNRDTHIDDYEPYLNRVAAYMNDNDVDSELLAMLMCAPFNIRATADFLIGPVNVGLNMIMPTGFNIAQGNWEDLIPESIDDAMVGVSLGIALL